MPYRIFSLTTIPWCAVVLVVTILGCIAGEGRGYPLYPTTGAGPMDPSRVVRLAGYVRFVDGVDVSEHGTRFELLPGCHLIGTPSRWGSASMSGGVAVSTGTLTFALPMKAGHQYAVSVETSLAGGGGPTQPAFVRAYERDASGAVTETFAPASSQSDVQRCRDLAGPNAEVTQPADPPRAVANVQLPDDSTPAEAAEGSPGSPASSPTPCPSPSSTDPGEGSAAKGNAPAARASAVAAWAHYRILAAGGPFCALDKDEVLFCLSSKRSCRGHCESTCSIACFVSRDASDNASAHCFTTMDACKMRWNSLGSAGQIGQYSCETVNTAQ